MRIAIVAPSFIPVPPDEYGGPELFIAHLAEGLHRRGLQVVVYTNGESSVSLDHMVQEYAVYYEAVLGEEQSQVA